MLEKETGCALVEWLQAYGELDESNCLRFQSLEGLEVIVNTPTTLADAGDGGSPFEAAAAATTALTNHARGAPVRPQARFDAFRRELGREPYATPWYVSYAVDFVTGFGASASDFNSHPAACVLATSSDDANPIGTLVELAITQPPPQVFVDKQMDAQLATFYLLLHRAENGAGETERRRRADTVLSALRTTYGAKNAAMLVIKPYEASASATSNTLSGTAAAGEARKTSDDGSADAMRKRRTRTKKDETAATTRRAPRTLADAVSGDDVKQLRALLGEVLQTGVVPSARATAALLSESVATRRSKFTRMSAWFGGGSKKPKPVTATGSAAAAAMLARPLEVQMRRLADALFVLRDWENALANYRNAASEFKGEKAHEQYASAQEMYGVTLLCEAAASSDRNAPRNALGSVASHLINAANGYERAGTRALAQRVALILQLVLREQGNHAAAADVCIRAVEFGVAPPSDDDRSASAMTPREHGARDSFSRENTPTPPPLSTATTVSAPAGATALTAAAAAAAIVPSATATAGGVVVTQADELFEAIMQEQTALSFVYRRPASSFRRCMFRLVLAGSCYANAGQVRLRDVCWRGVSVVSQRVHALRCFATAFAAYDALGWRLITEQLTAVLVRQLRFACHHLLCVFCAVTDVITRYAYAGQLDRALKFALTLLQSHGASPAAVQAAQLREFLYLHQVRDSAACAMCMPTCADRLCMARPTRRLPRVLSLRSTRRKKRRTVSTLLVASVPTSTTITAMSPTLLPMTPTRVLPL
jgi:hypothetical protein